MYQRPLKLYKGVDNIVRFVFKNGDQKPVNITGWDVTFHILNDDEGAVLVNKLATVIDAVKGIVTVTVDELDLMNLLSTHYNYSLSVTDPLTGTQQVVYSSDNYDVRGQIILLSGHYPQFKPSINVQIPTDSNASIITSAVQADTPTLRQSAHHTAQYYFEGFTGNISIQATLDALPPNGTMSSNTSVSWSTISNTTYSDQNLTQYQNFDGVYSAVRFVITPSIPAQGNVTKILYRS